MRGRRASFATTERIWWSLNTLQEQTIIDLLLTNEPDEGREGKDSHYDTAPSRHKAYERRSGHIGAVRVPRRRCWTTRGLDGAVSSDMTAHFYLPCCGEHGQEPIGIPGPAFNPWGQ
jgi:hypothetical protein